MTWWRESEGYHVLFNRDELKTRSEALPPTLQTTEDSTRFLAPTDPDAGGTWMLSNHYGVTIALLNLWHQQGDTTEQTLSRGQLVLSLADLQSAKALSSHLHSLQHTRPFTVVALDHSCISAYEWDGDTVSEITPKPPLTSSSFRFEDVAKSRLRAYQLVTPDCPTEHWKYHRGQNDDISSAYTVRMLRDDAQTWSTSRISVTQQATHWEYLREFPEHSSAPELHEISLSHSLSHSH